MPARKPKFCPHRARFGKNLARLRTRLGLSQIRLAAKSELSLCYIQDLEAGDYHPPVATLARIKMALRCQWNDLYAGHRHQLPVLFRDLFQHLHGL